MRTIQLKEVYLSPTEVEPRIGDFMTEADYDHLVGGDESVEVLKPDGSPLLIYVANVLPRALCEVAFDVFKRIDFESGGSNRGAAAGKLAAHDDPAAMTGQMQGGTTSGRGLRINPVNEDGRISRTSRAANVPTSIIGFYPRYPRIPYCRQTAFTMNNPQQWARAVPFIQYVSTVFGQYAHPQYLAQKEFVERCSPDFVIPGTIFSTLTVNRNWRTALHYDKGDFRSGLGCMAVLQAGVYGGGELVFPEFRVAVDMRTGGVALADVHSAHGNNEIKGKPGQHIRISSVFYCREDISECGTAAEELKRAQQVGDRIAAVQATKELKLF